MSRSSAPESTVPHGLLGVHRSTALVRGVMQRSMRSAVILKSG
jgi:hypothetical protein